MRDQIHDCYIDVYNETPSHQTIANLIAALPSDIKMLAEQWGWNDTEVANKVYVWLKEEKSN